MFAKQMNGLILPPNVNGRCRGQLNIYLNEINWKSNIVNAFYGIQIKFIWWGENRQTAATLCITNNKSKNHENVLKYSILTRLKLFKHYLLSCEPVEIELTSITTSFAIGKTFIHIPKDLINYLKGSVKSNGSSFINVNQKIINNQNKHIGDITIGFELIEQKELDTEQHKMVMPLRIHRPTVQQHKTEVRKRISELTLENINDNKKSLLFNYLTGQPLSAVEENNALREMHLVSPPESFIEDITDEVNTITLNSHRNNGIIPQLLSSFDETISMKISLYDLKLTDAGLEKAKHAAHSNSAFIIESILDSPAVKRKRCEQRLKMPLIIGSTSSIDINQELIQQICIPANDAQLSLSAITIIFWCKSPKETKIFGSAYINFKSIDSKLLRQPVRSVENQNLLGTLTANIIIEKHKLSDKNTSWLLSLSDENSIYSSADSLKQVNKVRYCNDKNLNNLILGASLHDTTKDCLSTGTSSTQTSNGQNQNQSNSLQFENSQNAECGKGEMRTNHPNDDENNEPSKSLHGLFYVGLIQLDHRQQDKINIFLLCRRFWANTGMFTTCTRSNIINFLEEFPVNCDESFLERTKQNSMVVEVWQKEENQVERIIGVTTLPLHQFYIAFSNVTVMKHVSKQKLPVVSIDGWSTIISPETSQPIGTLQIILAVGSEEQIKYLKNKRDLTSCSEFLYPPLQHLPIATKSAFMVTNSPNEISLHINGVSKSATYEKSPRADTMSRLNSFLDKLVQNLPAKTALDGGSNNKELTVNNSASSHSEQCRQIRPTSDLLDQLQNALSVPPTLKTFDYHNNHECSKDVQTSAPMIDQELLKNKRYFYVTVEIESAVISDSNTKLTANLSIPQKLTGQGNGQYVTFKAATLATNNSSDFKDFTYTTNIVENSRTPQWNKIFKVFLPVEFLVNDNKKFNLNIWRRTPNFETQSPSELKSIEDTEIGTVSINLTVLLSNIPSIAGWFNILDPMGNEIGQIKVNIQPLEDVKAYRQITDIVPKTISDSDSIDEQNSFAFNLNDITVDGGILSRTLKRKFTELEEISNRLRSRLLDVNDMPIHLDDEFDEFENDLNTIPDDEDNNWMDFSQTPPSAFTSKSGTAKASATRNTDVSGDDNAFRVNVHEIESRLTKEKLSELLNAAVTTMHSKRETERITGISDVLTNTKISDDHTDN